MILKKKKENNRNEGFVFDNCFFFQILLHNSWF